MNKEQMKNNPDPIKAMAGISIEKLNNAKLYKNLIQLSPF